MSVRQDRRYQWKRISWILASTSGVIVSLLTFPNAIAWMVAGWLLCHTVLVLRGGSGWVPLVTCAVILAIKNVDWSPALLLLAAVMLAIGLCRGVFCRKRFHDESRRKFRRVDGVGLAVVWAAWIIFACSWWTAARCSRDALPPVDRPVVCIGDSLTAFGYPENLAQMISLPVVNHAANGITSVEGLARLPDVIDSQPAVVVIELGGHDFLKGKSREATKANLQAMIDACRAIGAEVILMEIPRGFIIDAYGGLERELARKNDLELIPDSAIRNLVLWSPFAPPGMCFDSTRHLSDDGLHPNAQGNQFLAEQVTDSLVRLYGRQVRAR